MSWTTATDLVLKARKLWDSQRFLKAWLADEALFPMEFSVVAPGGSELSERYAEARQWLKDLRTESKETRGTGFRLIDKEIGHRQLGTQWLPHRALLETEEDFLALVRKQQAFTRFKRLVETTRREVPGLEALLRARPSMVLDHADSWPQALAVCRFFQAHPRPGMYLRQLEIEGVDTKFIERHAALLSELLDVALAPEARDEAVRGLRDHGFERRYGLRFDPPLIRFRLLDERLSLEGLKDLTVPLPEFARLSLKVQRVFITENKTNGLCFPEVPGAMVVFGLGYGIQALAGIAWLQDMPIDYWGDIDTHGFAILSQLRGYYPQVRSLLMDHRTLMRHRALWGQEPADKRCLQDLANLSPEEGEVFRQLRGDMLGDRIRLEQERLPFSYVADALEQRVG